MPASKSTAAAATRTAFTSTIPTAISFNSWCRTN